MNDDTGDIYFFSSKKETAWLSNFYRSRFIDHAGLEYQTVEHYYQCHKANTVPIRDWIRRAPTPYLAMKAGRALRVYELNDWTETRRLDVMRYALTQKFAQNLGLAMKLLGTGDRALHEDSPSDKFWGVKGKDHLGRMLMDIRHKIRTGVIKVYGYVPEH